MAVKSNALLFLTSVGQVLLGDARPEVKQAGADLQQAAKSLETAAPYLVADVFNAFTKSVPGAEIFQPLADPLIEGVVTWSESKFGGILDKAIGISAPAIIIPKPGG
jgi:hypothetical protein